MKKAYPDFYNDVFGPIMQPFSSSHTAAPCRIGYLANSLLNEPVKRITISISPAGSFASSLHMMNVDLALLSGCTGHLPDNKIMFEMREYCRRENIEYNILFEELHETSHHSAARIVLEGVSGKCVSLTGNSVGGGKIETVAVNGFPLKTEGDSYVIILFGAESSDMNTIREKIGLPLLDEGNCILDGQSMIWFATAEKINADQIKLRTGIESAEVLKPVQTVLSRPERKPQLFGSFMEWKNLAETQGVELWEVAVRYEMDSSCWERDRVIAYMRDVVQVKMHRTTHAVLEEGITPKDTPFTGHFYRQWADFAEGTGGFADSVIARAVTYAMAAQAPVPGVEFVPAPMGAGGGLLYSSLCAVREERGYSEDQFIKGLFVAAGVGAVCFTRTEPGGVNIGCAGEQGICSAMASAAIVAMAGGSADQIEWAASYCLQISAGWPCDPTPGGKNMPCYARAITGVTMAIVFAQMALAGRSAVFPLDEAIDVIDSVGRRLPAEIRGTSTGAFAACPTGLECTKAFNEWSRLNSKSKEMEKSGL